MVFHTLMTQQIIAIRRRGCPICYRSIHSILRLKHPRNETLGALVVMFGAQLIIAIEFHDTFKHGQS